MSVADRVTESRTTLLALGLFLAMLALPVTGLLSTFHLGLVISAMVLALFALSFNLLFGYTGLLSFGHAAYFGTGAYTLALALDGKLGFLPGVFETFVPALLLSVGVAGLVALVFGYLCVQRGDIYFAILTLALSMMLYETMYTWNDFTGGSDGITVLVEPIELGGLTVNLIDTGTFYYLALLVLAASGLVLWRLVNSPYGELLLSIRENPERAKMVGIPVKRYQLSAFVIAGLFAGLAGTLFAVRTFIVTPHTLHWSMSAEPVMMTLLGGPSAFFGPIIGAVVFVGLEQVLSNVTEYWQFGLGLIIVPVVLFFPDGIAGLVRGDDSALADARAYLDDIRGGDEPGIEENHHE
ncbi:branched-chain amino acid ABC transporter permease [Halorientalis pallida]|uniref:branched-chain amino acid ABC transporter permease n=1 Tax=Halorientalis pallida TaxID=2479928 RepID=UPI003C6EE1F1